MPVQVRIKVQNGTKRSWSPLFLSEYTCLTLNSMSKETLTLCWISGVLVGKSDEGVTPRRRCGGNLTRIVNCCRWFERFPFVARRRGELWMYFRPWRGLGAQDSMAPVLRVRVRGQGFCREQWTRKRKCGFRGKQTKR